jgi:hypothetical protein
VAEKKVREKKGKRGKKKLIPEFCVCVFFLKLKVRVKNMNKA